MRCGWRPPTNNKLQAEDKLHQERDCKLTAKGPIIRCMQINLKGNWTKLYETYTVGSYMLWKNYGIHACYVQRTHHSHIVVKGSYFLE